MVYEDETKNIVFEYDGQKYCRATKNTSNVIEWKEPLTIVQVRNTISKQLGNGLRQWPALDVINHLKAKYNCSFMCANGDGYADFDLAFHVGNSADMIILSTYTCDADDWWYRGTMKNDLKFMTKPWTLASAPDTMAEIDSDSIKLWISIHKDGKSLIISFSRYKFKMTEEDGFVECSKKKRGRPRRKRRVLPVTETLPVKPKAEKPKYQKRPDDMLKYVTDQLGERFNKKWAWDPRDVLKELKRIGDEYDVLNVPKFEIIPTSIHWNELNNTDEQELAMIR